MAGQKRGPERAWKKVTWAQAKRDVDALAQAILDMKLTPEGRSPSLGQFDRAHALMTQAAMQAGIPVAPVSPAYSLMSQDHASSATSSISSNGAVLVQDGVAFSGALAALDLDGVHGRSCGSRPEGVKPAAPGAISSPQKPTDAVESLRRRRPKTVGKLLFTSGSTGMPKAVINTQEMMCANVVMGQMTRKRSDKRSAHGGARLAAVEPHDGRQRRLPRADGRGGTLYIDDGRPVPGMFDETCANLKEISPTYYANVPGGLRGAGDRSKTTTRSPAPSSRT